MHIRKHAAISGGMTTGYLTLIIILPLAIICSRAFEDGIQRFSDAATNPQAVAALKLTLTASAIVALINALTGTVLAWVLVRDSFHGKGVIDLVVDLPFALPTIVAGLTLLTLYGPKSPVGIDIAYTKVAIIMALLFVTLPFVVRSVQPVLLELDQEMEEAAASLGASKRVIFRRIIFPNLVPAIASGTALGFARAIGEFGSLVLIAGNLPFKTEYASVFIYGQIESDRITEAAAVSTMLLLAAFIVLLCISGISRKGGKHAR